MSGLLSSLSNNSAALNRHAAGLEVTGRNLANVNNPNYARQRLETTSHAGPGGLTHTQTKVTQLRDALLDRSLVREKGTTGSLEAQQEVLDQLDAALGERLSGSIGASLATASEEAAQGLTNSLSDFFNAWDEFSANPGDSGVRQRLLDSADFLTGMLNDVGAGIDAVEADLDAAANRETERANELVGRIAQLNQDISRIEGRRNGQSGELRDERQAAIEELGQLVSIETAAAETPGMVNVSVTSEAGDTISLVAGGAVSNTLSVVTGGNGEQVLAIGDAGISGGGKINGFLSVRSNELAQLRSEMDALSSQLVSSVNGIYNPDGTGTNFFNPDNLTAGTISLADDLTVENLRNATDGSAGGNDIALGIAALRNQSFDPAADAFGGTFHEQAISSVTSIGQSISNASERLEHQEVVESMLREQRAAVSGVDQNEEATQMILSQRAFQASARVVTTIDRLLETVISGMGA